MSGAVVSGAVVSGGRPASGPASSPASSRAATLRGPEGFEAYYGAAFGAEWPRLRESLLERPAPVARLNGFAAPSTPVGERAGPAVEVPGCVNYEGGNPERDGAGLLEYYVLDAASVWAAISLGVTAGERVLDLCGAPGGKALVLAEALASKGELVANDRSPARVQRLRRVFADYLPAEMRQRVTVTQRDGRRWGVTQPGAFDAVLLDAPCSSERHVLGAPAELAKWSAGRVARLAQDQYALLTSALLALRPGGRVLYCTCALAPAENDGVIERLLERGRHRAEPEPLALPLGAATRHGWQMLPHRDGCGPLYLCRLVKEP